MSNTHQLQNKIHNELEGLVNGTHSFQLIDLLLPYSVQRNDNKAFEQFTGKYKQFLESLPAKNEINVLTSTVQVYSGQNNQINGLSKYLNKLEQWKGEIKILVHGSLASGEEKPYSDMDLLVILGESICKDSNRLTKVTEILYNAKRFMFQFDPLQHHGWFVLHESDFRNYCQAYFPSVLFQHAKVLYPSTAIELQLQIRDSSRECRHFFEGLCKSIITPIVNSQYPTTMYELKSMLSRFMLLPSAFYQTINTVGIWKKDSFEVVRPFFPKEDFVIMDHISNIRSIWPNNNKPWFPLFNHHPGKLGHIIRKHASRKIPIHLKSQLTEKHFKSMSKLSKLMLEKANHKSFLEQQIAHA